MLMVPAFAVIAMDSGSESVTREETEAKARRRRGIMASATPR
jgi:hypothetical protein